ncbi:hypothetical protein [Acidovorax sp. A1169]|uniref:hypothetical protein n=1 Tax=Acidovorax sp. A1169 TaxID=3059524 RepID=UPI002737BBF8|nr:hypothetical protein [Acidovorax sp. A1169]MDP4076229.1 hypothetical protein [Acidovorax sp. A1169]
MNATQLAEIILRASTRKLDDEVRIVAQARAATMGPRHTVGLHSAGYGIDWENGTFELIPATPLTVLTPEELAEVRKSMAMGQSWHAYKSWKKQDERIKALEAELATLRGRA